MRGTVASSLAGLLVLASTSAGALAPPLPDCAGVLVEAAERRAIGASDPDWFGYYYSSPLEGFVLYSFVPEDSDPSADGIVIFEHCASATQVFARMSPRGLSEDAFYDRWDRVVRGIEDRASPDNPRTYSMDDLAAFARGEGAQARVVRAGYESCACRMLAIRGW